MELENIHLEEGNGRHFSLHSNFNDSIGSLIFVGDTDKSSKGGIQNNTRAVQSEMLFSADKIKDSLLDILFMAIVLRVNYHI